MMARFPVENTAAGYGDHLDGNGKRYQQVKDEIRRCAESYGFTPEELKNLEWARKVEGFAWAGARSPDIEAADGGHKPSRNQGIYDIPVNITEHPDYEVPQYIRDRLNNFLFEEFSETFRRYQEFDVLRYCEDIGARALVRLLTSWPDGYEYLSTLGPEGEELPGKEDIETFIRGGGLHEFRCANRLYAEVPHSRIAVRRLLYAYSVLVRQAWSKLRRAGEEVDETLLPDEMMIDDAADMVLAGGSVAEAAIENGIPASGFRRRVREKIKEQKEEVPA